MIIVKFNSKLCFLDFVILFTMLIILNICYPKYLFIYILDFKF